MQPRNLLLALALAALVCVDVAAVAWPAEQPGWNAAKLWPVAVTVCQIVLAGAALIWGPGPLVWRIVAAALAIGFGCVVAERILLVPWTRPLGAWLLLGGMAAGLCGLLRIAGLTLMDAADPLPLYPEGEEPPSAAAKPGLGPRQYSLGALLTLMFGVALAAGILRYLQPSSPLELIAMALLCSGWAIGGIGSLLAVSLHGPLRARAVFLVLLVFYVLLVGSLLRGVTPLKAGAELSFLAVCLPVMALMGLAGGLVRILGFELCWED
jgi:hypothetical protein